MDVKNFKVRKKAMIIALHRIAIYLDTFLLIDRIWVDKANYESIITPRGIKIFSTFFKIMLFIGTDLCMFVWFF